MGTKYSREQVVDLEKITLYRTLNRTLNKTINKTIDVDSNFSSKTLVKMLDEKNYAQIIKQITKIFVKENIFDLKILEVGCEDRSIGFKIIEGLKKMFKISIYTDNYLDINVLLIIFPPSCSYMDYYAIKEFEQRQNIGYLIYLGDMGGTDGSAGLFKYLEGSPYKLLDETKIFEVYDYMGNLCEKNLFIYKLEPII